MLNRWRILVAQDFGMLPYVALYVALPLEVLFVQLASVALVVFLSERASVNMQVMHSAKVQFGCCAFLAQQLFNEYWNESFAFYLYY